MRRLPLSLFASLILFGLLLTPTSSKAGGEPHPLIRRAAAALRSAKTDLQNAAHDYCGHRVEALEAVNNALNQLQQALDCDSRKRSSAGADEMEAESSGTAGGERHPNIDRAISALGSAEGDLQNAAHDYCGHRVEALESTRSALNQLRLAIQCDKR
jgi:outer membrane protein TolC